MGPRGEVEVMRTPGEGSGRCGPPGRGCGDVSPRGGVEEWQRTVKDRGYCVRQINSILQVVVTPRAGASFGECCTTWGSSAGSRVVVLGAVVLSDAIQCSWMQWSTLKHSGVLLDVVECS